MEIYETRSGNAARHHWLLSLVLLTLIVFGSLILLQGLALLLVPILFDIPAEDFLLLISGEHNHPNARLAFLFIQGVGGGLGFLLGGFLFVKLVDKASFAWEQQFKSVKFKNLILIIPILFGFMLVNSFFIYWNINVEFPEFLREFENWAILKEEELMRVTMYLTDFNNRGEFLAGILVIGLLAGIGEEYLFRGVLQPKLHRYTLNAHAGIWITAVIFSAIHFQFYGFLPRMLLGALFGYLYLYSGSLVYPIIAHVLNNTFTIVAVYLNKLGIMEFDIEGGGEVEWYYVLLGLGIFILSFKAFISNKENNGPNGEMAKSI
ncbi:MAG: CPBP family intramembrane glutamic endopeptidase [Anditalea sp.]